MVRWCRNLAFHGSSWVLKNPANTKKVKLQFKIETYCSCSYNVSLSTFVCQKKRNPCFRRYSDDTLVHIIWPWPLTHWPWKRDSSSRNRSKHFCVPVLDSHLFSSSWGLQFTRFPSSSLCDLDLWLHDLENLTMTTRTHTRFIEISALSKEILRHAMWTVGQWTAEASTFSGWYVESM